MLRSVLLSTLFLLPILVFSQLIPTDDSEPGVLPRWATRAEIEQAQKENYRHPVMSRSVNTPPADKPNIRAAAQWEEIQAITISWRGYNGILKQIVHASVNECKVIILTEDPATTQAYLLNSSFGGPVDLTNVELVQTGLNSIWIRDYGANTVYGDEVDDLFLVDWIYNRPRPLDDVSPQAVADHLNLELYSTTTAPWNLWNCGGNFMQNGNGQGFASNLVLNENQGGTSSWGAPFPNHSEAQINNIQNQFLGIDEYIKMTVLPFDGINHIDMHMKLLDEETLLVSEYPEGVSDGPQIEANIAYIQNNFTTRYGNPYKIVRIPAPPAANNGNYPPNGWYCTYANGVFVNNTFIVPTYYEEYDTVAFRILQEALPGYNIVGIDVDNSGQNLISAGGAIHCITHTVGVDDPLLITYQKLPDTNETEEAYTLNAYLNHVSGVSSATLFWKTDLDAPYQSVPMTAIGGNNWSGDIPAQGLNTTVYYYVEGVANNGKTQTHPLPAPEGYRSFTVLSDLLGCTDPTACNYNPEAGVNDGSCIPAGCTDEEACNYNPDAGCDDDSCIIGTAWYVDADGDGFGDVNDENPICVNPCDGTYIVTITGGAWLDEVTWSLSDVNGNVVLNGGPYGNTQNGGSFTDQVSDIEGPLTFFIETQGEFNDNQPTYSITTGNGFVIANGTRPGGTTFTLENLACGFADNNLDCDDSNPNANPNNPQACPECIEPAVRVIAPQANEGDLIYTSSFESGWGAQVGATSITAQAVLVDDGTANGELGCNDLTNSAAIDGNIAVAVRGSCTFSLKAVNAQNAGAAALVIINNAPGVQTMGGGSLGGEVTIPVIMISQEAGNTLLSALNAGELVMFIGNDCETDCQGVSGGTAFIDGCGNCVGGFTGLETVEGCTDENACNYNPQANCDNGTCITPDGCTDAQACNYDPEATCDDSTCVYFDCYGCTDANGCNYDSEALIDDNSCIFPTTFWQDADGDGFGNPTVSDAFCEDPGAGWVQNDIDCDDGNAQVYPGAPGTAEGVDNNCNGVIDPSEEPAEVCTADLNGDGLVTALDLTILLADFQCTNQCVADIDGDGSVTAADLLILLAMFGNSCP